MLVTGAKIALALGIFLVVVAVVVAVVYLAVAAVERELSEDGE